MAAKMAMDPAIVEFFDSLTGSGAVNLNVVAAKYGSLRQIARDFIKALLNIADCPEFQAVRPAAAAECGALAKHYHRDFDNQLCAPVDVPIGMYDNNEATKEYRTKYGELYRRSKQAPVLATLLAMTGNMIALRTACEMADQQPLRVILDDMCLRYGDRDVPELLVFAVGQLENADAAETGLTLLAAENYEVAEKVWPLVRGLFLKGLELFSVLEQPDFDSDTIAQAVTSALEGCVKTLPRCEAGFALIKNSTDLFKKNASKYQCEIERSGNPYDLFRFYCEDINDYATKQLAAGGTEAEQKRARRTKIDLGRIMSHVGRTTQKMQAVAGPGSAGHRLLNVLSKQIEQTQKSFEDEILQETRASGPDAVRHMTERLRRQRAEDEAAAEQAAAEMLAQRSDAVLLLTGPPVLSADGANASPPSTDETWNMRAALRFLGEPTEKKKRHRKKKKAAGGEN